MASLWQELELASCRHEHTAAEQSVKTSSAAGGGVRPSVLGASGLPRGAATGE